MTSQSDKRTLSEPVACTKWDFSCVYTFRHCARYCQKFFFKNFCRTRVLFVGQLIALFWTSGDVCPGFQSQGGSLTCTLSCLRNSPQIHLWCETCWLYQRWRAEWVLHPFCPSECLSTIDIMLNFDGDCNGDGHSVGMFKHSLFLQWMDSETTPHWMNTFLCYSYRTKHRTRRNFQ